MNSKLKNRLLFLFPILAIVFFSVFHLCYVERVSYNVPHMDSWLILADLVEKFSQGNVTLADWFPIPHGEYFSLLGTPVAYLLHLTDWNYQLLTYLSVVFHTLESIVIYCAYARSIKNRTNKTKLVYSIGFISVLLGIYNLNQWEIASFDCAFEFFNRIFFYCFTFSYIDKVLQKAEKRVRDYIWCGLLCFVVIIVISHAYFPGAIATIAITMLYDYFSKRDWKSIGYYFIVALFVILSGSLYIATYSFGQVSSTIATGASIPLIDTLITYVKSFLIMTGASLLHQSELTTFTPYYFAGAAIFVISIVSSVIYIKKGKHHQTYLPLMLILYGFVSIAIIVIARSNRFNLYYMTTSRYVVETTLILIGTLWLLISLLADYASSAKPTGRILKTAVCLTVILLISIGIINCNKIEWAIAPYRKEVFKTTAYNMINIDYVSDAALGITQAPAASVREAVAVLKKYEKSIFAALPYSKELQDMQLDQISAYQYKPDSGFFADGWVSNAASLYIQTGTESTLSFTGYYPYEITGNETVTFSYGDTTTEYVITSNLFEFVLSVPQETFFKLTLETNFDHVNSPDVRSLAFVFNGIHQYEDVTKALQN